MKRFLFVLFAILAFVLIVSCDMEIPVVEDKPSETNSSEQDTNNAQTDDNTPSTENVETSTKYYDSTTGALEREAFFDDSGKLIKLTIYNTDGSIDSWEEYEYDPETGNRARSTYYYSDGTLFFESEYDLTIGKVIKRTYYNSDGSISSNNQYVYDESTGKKIKEIGYRPDGSKVSETIFDQTTGRTTKHTS